MQTIKHASDLSQALRGKPRAELENFITALFNTYHDLQENDTYAPDEPLSGADLVDAVNELFTANLGLRCEGTDPYEFHADDEEPDPLSVPEAENE